MNQIKNSILDVEQLTAGYGSHTVLEDVSFTLNEGEVLGIIGQNGSGKSTLLKALIGLIPCKKGSVQWIGQKMNKLTAHKMLEKGISFFTQNGLIMPALSVEEHLSLASLKNGNGKTNFESVFEQFPKLYELKSQRAGSLSGGERQMLSFGILIVQGKKTWLLDEPTSGLSPGLVKDTIRFLSKKNREEGITMLLVEHNMDVAFILSDHIAVTKDGTLTYKFEEEEFERSEFLTQHVYN